MRFYNAISLAHLLALLWFALLVLLVYGMSLPWLLSPKQDPAPCIRIDAAPVEDASPAVRSHGLHWPMLGP